MLNKNRKQFRIPNYGFGISLITLFFIAYSLNFTYSQQKYNDKEIRVSPKAGVMQVVGLTKINISYSRPGVKGRVIWGKLVPYNVVWRAGADEATKFTFSTDVKINGKKLKAGSYSFFAIPSKNGEWTLIFNKVADQWGAFEYNISEDVLRFKVKPEKGSFVEWLRYTFTKTSDVSAVIRLEWDKLKIPFTVEVTVEK
jgi:hypothetical protein